MPVNKQEIQKDATVKRQRLSGRKAPGTRVGIWENWREDSTRCGKISGRYGHVVRDGR